MPMSFAVNFLRIVAVLAALAAVLFGAFLLFVCFAGPMMGRLVKDRIEAMDRNVIGVDVTIGSLLVAMHTGKIELRDFVVMNPSPYSSEYLLKAGHVKIDVSMTDLLRSRARNITVQNLVFEDVDAIWEKSGLMNSNIKAIFTFIEGKKAVEVAAIAVTAPSQTASAPACQLGPQRKFKVREVVVKDVGVKMASHMLGGRGVRLALGDVSFQDFSRDVGQHLLEEIVREILYSVLKTIVQNCAGKSIGDELF